MGTRSNRQARPRKGGKINNESSVRSRSVPIGYKVRKTGDPSGNSASANAPLQPSEGRPDRSASRFKPVRLVVSSASSSSGSMCWQQRRREAATLEDELVRNIDWGGELVAHTAQLLTLCAVMRRTVVKRRSYKGPKIVVLHRYTVGNYEFALLWRIKSCACSLFRRLGES